MNPKHWIFQLKNNLGELEKLCRQIKAFGLAAGLPEKGIFELNLVLDELFTNVVTHGFETPYNQWISYDCIFNNQTVTVRIEDAGIPFNPLTVRCPDLKCASIQERKIGGVGIHLVKQYVDDIYYERRNNRNILILKKKIS